MVDLEGIEPPCDQLRFLFVMSESRYKSLERAIGFEPTFSTPITLSNLEDCCGYTRILYLVVESNYRLIRVKDSRFHYANKVFELHSGIEPDYPAYKADASPFMLMKQLRLMRGSNPLRTERQSDILTI